MNDNNWLGLLHLSGLLPLIFPSVIIWNLKKDKTKDISNHFRAVITLQLSIRHRWIDDLSLEPIANDFFKTDWGYYIKFNRKEDGDILSLSVNSGRTLNVIFHRKE